MVQIDPKTSRYIVSFKKKDERPNKTDDKIEILRHAIGLAEVRDMLELLRFTGHHATSTMHRTNVTVTDINSYYNPYVIIRLTKEQAIRLRKDPNVLIVEREGYDPVTVENLGYQINQHAAGVTWVAPLGFRGTGVNVGVIDTGTDPNHVDLRANLAANADFTGRGGVPAEDNVQHGTHCCGIISAVQGNNVGMAGIAPSSRMWSLKAGGPEEGTGRGLVFHGPCVEALEYAKANNIQVISMSFGGTQDVATRAASIRDGYDRLGVLYFGSTGNDGTNGIVNYPAGSYGVNGVGAVDVDDNIANFSNRGSFCDYVGSGVEVWSTANGDVYRALSGTSMGCPSAAAVAVLGLSAFKENNTCPPYTPGQRKNQIIEAVMNQTCLQPSGAPGSKNITFGFGIPRANSLVRVLQQTTT